MTAYMRYPALSREQLAVVAEDALWVAPRDGGRARRLTADGQEVRHVVFSPAGDQLVFASTFEGSSQVYRVPVEGGVPQRLTFESEPSEPVGFRPSGRLVVRSLKDAPLRSFAQLYELELDGSGWRRLPVGRAVHIAFDDDDDRVVIGQSRLDVARWKRYRGGMQGDAWIGSLSSAEFRRLVELEAGPVQPCFAAGRVYFLSDQDGVGHLYSCAPDGSDLRQETRGGEFYARHLSARGTELAYCRGGRLVRFDVRARAETPIEIDVRPQGAQLARRFVTADESLEAVQLDPESKQLAGLVRGKPVTMDVFGAASMQLGRRSGVGYRLPRWLGKRDAGGKLARSREVVVVSDEGGEEALEAYDVVSRERTARVALAGLALVHGLYPAPDGRVLALTDVAGGLFVCRLGTGGEPDAIGEIGRSPTGAVRHVAWSADGRWIAWIQWEGALEEGGLLHLFDRESGARTVLGDAELPVHSPAFDPEGRFLYVLAERAINPVLDRVQFGASCTASTRVYAYVLAADGLSPFDPRWPERWEEEKRARRKGRDDGHGAREGRDGEDDDYDYGAPARVAIDLDGLERRLVEFPDVPPGSYSDLAGTKEGVLLLRWKELGLLDAPDIEEQEVEQNLPALMHLELASGKSTTVLERVTGYHAQEAKTLVCRPTELFVFKTGEAAPEDPPRGGPGPGTGEVDLDRMRVEIEPAREWRQMFTEAWRMQREHFWRADMSAVDWEAVGARYLPLVERVSTRAELSDLIWEMQSELGTSHAYEMGGDYPGTRSYPVGLLGADLAWDGAGYRIERILDGDPWAPGCRSPLADPGVSVRAGERIVAIDGRPLDARTPPGAVLAGRAGRHAELTLAGAGGARQVVVRTLESERALRYRDWVKRNRAHVRRAADGRLGYLHVPDMMGEGLAEFLRAFRSESKFPGLVVDARENGGGFLSSIVVDCLRRKVLGHARPRHGRYETYPPDAVHGPIVTLCDQFTGSDGDIFCHAVRAAGIGPLVGKRTWGGVVGIDPQRTLVDGTVVTQPEWAFWFEGVGWGIENHGVEPDVDVDLDPASMAAGRDPQLDRAIELALAMLEDSPVREPDWE